MDTVTSIKYTKMGLVQYGNKWYKNIQETKTWWFAAANREKEHLVEDIGEREHCD